MLGSLAFSHGRLEIVCAITVPCPCGCRQDAENGFVGFSGTYNTLGILGQTSATRGVG